MRRQDFTYHLPETLIAKNPPKVRGDSRLLTLDGGSGELRDTAFKDITDYLRAGDLLVFNDTRVIPARLYGRKATGGKIELLVERFLEAGVLLAQVRASKAPGPGTKLILEDGTEVTVSARRESLFEIRFPSGVDALGLVERIGHTPLPPYIDRKDTENDKERYQTVYNKVPGAVAAPTAGLHFTHELLTSFAERGIDTAFVTLHVGAGTFQPVRVDELEAHRMHSEFMVLEQRVCEQVAATKARGGRVVAVGTTSVRCLESAALSGALAPFKGETDIFIFPGYKFRVVDALVTNFHLPESTLLMLVCAFAGFKNTMAAYSHAVVQAYRFFSYGDAMFITRNREAPGDSTHFAS